jgi:hypothetical protein
MRKAAVLSKDLAQAVVRQRIHGVAVDPFLRLRGNERLTIASTVAFTVSISSRLILSFGSISRRAMPSDFEFWDVPWRRR